MTGNPQLDDAVHAVLARSPCSVTLPAGSGKTELIAAAVARIAERGGSSLVLTHTHAGVDALRRRMRKFDVEQGRVLVRTIDSWSYDLVAHFPLLGQLAVPTVPDWSSAADYHRAAARAAGSRAVTRMLRISYSNLFVDEYQDCLTSQHELAIALARALPTVVLGDPLQCLFNFGTNDPVDWDTEVRPNFPSVAIDHKPHRWHPDHPALGNWLTGARNDLMNGLPLDLTSAPVTWVRRTHARTFVNTCYSATKINGTIAVLGRFRSDCVNAASKLGGTYTVMEAMDEKITAVLASTIDTKSGADVAAAAVAFGIAATSGLAAHIPPAKRQQLAAGQAFATKNTARHPAYEAITELRSTPTPATVRAVLRHMEQLPGVTLHCRDAWNEVLTAADTATSEGCTMSDALRRTRSHARAVGRRPAARVVSRPLLVKGLEYDHVIILDPSQYSTQELYVALTRGSKSVTVISDNIILPAIKKAARQGRLANRRA